MNANYQSLAFIRTKGILPSHFDLFTQALRELKNLDLAGYKQSERLQPSQSLPLQQVLLRLGY